ncbi:GNAT family N-acetyltransferase [Dielma fastidiosa]|uniref:GNAT family N-acetyltransferase n=1 Tax=Dielma fastidiosa TaxID=1034346 RepID=UPI000EC3DBF5|nr:GNAT family N-acetyltransferase [Dielma fastidiosa]HAH94868.1 GNAT family N-acetyltransferase [Dielma fastidiosa]
MIRIYRNADQKAVMSIWLQSNLKAHSFIAADYWQSHYEEVAEMLSSAQLLVAENDGRICGFIGMYNEMIAGLFVDEHYRGKGIGKMLLDTVKQMNYQLYLQVYKKNKRALHFYQRESFSIEKEQQDVASGEIEYVMKWVKKKL